MNALRTFLKMNASRVFLLAAVIISSTIVLANLHKLERESTERGVYRINTVTDAAKNVLERWNIEPGYLAFLKHFPLEQFENLAGADTRATG